MIVRGATSVELARRIRHTVRFTELVLHDLRERELVERDAAGLWRITATGLSYLEELTRRRVAATSDGVSA